MRRITKESVRALVGLKRLPKRLRMYVAGCWLYDVLKANNISVSLWAQSYWVVIRSLDANRMTINWRACK